MENFKIPLVLAVALGAQLVGAVFWGSNILRDISDNTARTDELIEILLETEEALEMEDEEIWHDVENLVKLQTQIIKMQARISILEKTVEFSRRDGM